MFVPSTDPEFYRGAATVRPIELISH